GRFDLFDIRLHGETLVDDALAGGRGAFLMGAHLGSSKSYARSAARIRTCASSSRCTRRMRARSTRHSPR
ncbi:hypothetical protein, partial [Escherichia coli]|uniref:hypothetical protein n=1 Tax=Escherichia coli TaxID=562 RepID=UPI0019D6EDA7